MGSVLEHASAFALPSSRIHVAWQAAASAAQMYGSGSDLQAKRLSAWQAAAATAQM